MTIYTGKCGDNVTYTMDSDTSTMIISGTGAMYDYSSTNLAPWQKYNTSGTIRWSWASGFYCTIIIIEDGVTRIGTYAFAGLPAMTVVIGKDVNAIGMYAFYQSSVDPTFIFCGNQPTLEDYCFHIVYGVNITGKATFSILSNGWASSSIFVYPIKASYDTVYFATLPESMMGGGTNIKVRKSDGTWTDAETLYLNVDGTWELNP